MINYLKQKQWINIIKKSGLFDTHYYLFTYPDVRKSEIDPIVHYVKYGIKEGRNPNQKFNTNEYIKLHPIVHQTKINPLVHYIIQSKNDNALFSNNMSKNDKKQIIRKLVQLKEQNIDIVVILHVFYPELINEILEYMNNIEFRYTLIVTYPKNRAAEIKPFIRNLQKNRIEIEVENNGYDILPFLQILPLIINSGYKYFCKIHTKRDHVDPNIGKYWRESLLDGVLGNKILIRDIINAFKNNSDLYMVGSRLNYLSFQATKYNNEENIQYLAALLKLPFNQINDFGFIAGTMFWGKTDFFSIFKNLQNEVSTKESFSGETSSIFHAIERIFGLLTLKGLKIGLIDYKLSNNDVNHCLILENNKPLIALPKDRYKAFHLRSLYLKYSLLKKANLIDSIWCYNNYSKLTNNWKDCFLAYLEKEIQYISKDHESGHNSLNFTTDSLQIKKDNQETLITLESYNLCDNITNHEKYFDLIHDNNSDIIVSVIVLTYNHENYIEIALDSIISQKTKFKYEIIVGDDNSSDNTASIIKKYYNQYPDRIVPVLREKNIGVYNNLQDLVNLAKGKYLAFNEGDDYWTDINKLQIQVNYLENNLDCSVCFHLVNVYDEEEKKYKGIFPNNLEGTRFNFERIFQSNIIQTNSVMYRNNVLKNQNLNPRTLPLDWLFHMKNALYGEIHLIPKIMGTYRIHSGGIWSKKSLFFREHNEGNIYVLKEILNISKQRVHNDVIPKMIKHFTQLYWHYFKRQNIEKLFDLIQIDVELTKLFFQLNKIPIVAENIKNKQDLIYEYKKIYHIDVILTAYNQESYILQALNSIINQKGLFSLNIIIADDSSSDGTMSKIKKAINLNTDITIQILDNSINLGMLKNMERAFKECHGNYVAICEGDDYWISEEKLHKQLSLMLTNPSFSMCFNWILLEYVDESFHVPHPGQAKLEQRYLDFDAILNDPVIGNFSCCFYKNETIKKIPESYFMQNGNADWLFNLYAANQGEIGFLKDILSVYRVHSNGQWSGLSPEQQRISMKKFYNEFMNIFPNKKQKINECLTKYTN